MAPDPVTHERIYDSIKQDLLDGRFRPGLRLEIQAIAERHRTSTTPIREVLHRLEGERLIEPRSEGGYRISVPDTENLRALYAWNLELLASAIRIAPAHALRESMRSFRSRAIGEEPLAAVNWSSAFFHSLAVSTGNPEFVHHIENANERLVYLRIAEAHVFDDIREQSYTLVRNGRPDVRRALSQRLRLYHRVRIKAASTIIKAVT